MRLAIDLGGTTVRAAVEGDEGPAGPFRSRVKRPSDGERGREAIYDALIRAAEDAVDVAGLSWKDITGVGVCVPGVVEPDTGVVLDCSNLPGWDSLPLGQRLRDRWGVGIDVVNDANAACWAEYATGAGQGTRHMAFVTLSTGVGAGFVIDGKLYQGARGVAGEVGETRDDTGETVERRASGSGLTRNFGIKPEELRALWDSGDADALRAFDDLVTHAGRLLANLATLLDPERIVVGGGLSQLGPWLLERLTAWVEAEAYSLAKKTPLVLARWADDAGLRGLLALGPDSQGARGV
jgi:glucokinase